MAAKQQIGDDLSAHIAGLSRSQLFDIMSQMKALIDENQEQARQILIDNPALTRALFQAQIMLGMVKPPKTMPVIKQAVSRAQSSETALPSVVEAPQLSLAKSALQDRASFSQPPLTAKQQNVVQPSASFPPPSNSMSSLDIPTMPTNRPQSAQVKGFPIHQVPSISIPQSCQHPNATLPPPPVPSQYSTTPSHVPIVHSQPQQPLQNPGIFNQQLQPPLPQLPRPPSMQPFTHQMHPQIPNSYGLNPSNASQHMLQQPMFHTGGNPPTSFPAGPPPLPCQPPPQQLYQPGSHVSGHYNPQTAVSMQFDRSTLWARGHPEASLTGSHFPGQLPLVPGQITQGMSGTHPARPEPLTPEMEKMLVQQVMSMSPEQINVLPPEQRQQVLQLREMLRP